MLGIDRRALIRLIYLPALLAAAAGTISCGSEEQFASIPTPPPLEIDIEPSWSPDGGTIAYVHIARDIEEGAQGPWQIWLHSVSTGEREYLIEGDHPDWSPDGTNLVFTGGRGIQLVDIKTGGVREVISMPVAAFPQWSPEGDRILFRPWVDSTGMDLYLVNTDGAGLVHLPISAPSGGDWSPDGSEVCVTSYFDGRRREVGIFDLQDLHATPITSLGGDARYPAWSPDGGWVAYSFSRMDSGRESGLYRTRPDGTGTERICRGGNPSWSPDSRYIVYEGLNEEEYSISLWVIDVESGETGRIEAFRFD